MNGDPTKFRRVRINAHLVYKEALTGAALCRA
jgi:hypothetical protein